MAGVRTVVFDMDGTLVQTRAASWEVFKDTAQRFDLPVRTAEDFYRLFEDNFFDSLNQLSPDQHTADAVREHMLTGMRERYHPDFVPGMVDVIKALAPHYALAVMSSNSMDAIRRILQGAGVAQCFAHVFSAEVGTSKRDHLRRVRADPAYGGVRRCSPAYLESGPGPAASGGTGFGEVDNGAQVVLITDTIGDVAEAKASGIRAIGVTWGMHGVDALLAAGAERVVYWPQEIIALLLPEGTAPAACACTASSGCTVAARFSGTAAAGQPPAARPTNGGWAREPTAARQESPIEQANRLGRNRHARRTAAVGGSPLPQQTGHIAGSAPAANSAASAGACRCGRGCNITDEVHTCGGPGRRQASTDARSQLAAAIARISARPP